MGANEDPVSLDGPGNWTVPRRWYASPFVLYTEPGSGTDSGTMPGAIASADIEMRGKKPKLTRLHLDAVSPTSSWDGVDLAAVDWERSLHEAAFVEAARWRLNTYFPEEQRRRQDKYGRLRPEQWEQVWPGIEQGRDEVHRALRTAQRKNGVTLERLAEVLRLYDEHGIDAVIEQTGKSRSYAYQLLARARKELS
jgi:hypothetical protein